MATLLIGKASVSVESGVKESVKPNIGSPKTGQDGSTTATDADINTSTSDSIEEPPVPYSAFSRRQRIYIVILCSMAGFFSPFSALAYFPSLDYIAADLGVSIQLMNLTITMYLVVQGIAPALVGDLADQFGRRPLYITVLALYFAACIALALQRSYPALLVLRMVQSAGSSGTIALAMMTVADLAPPHERGSYVGAMISGPNSAPSLGPVLGGLLAQLAGWPWIFWFLAILGGIAFVPFILFFPETSRLLVGNGSKPPRPLNKPLFTFLCPREAKQAARLEKEKPYAIGYPLQHIPNPFRCLKIVARRQDALLLFAYACIYSSYSCIQASLATLLMRFYGLNALQAGLCYLAYGIATFASSYVVGMVLDYDYRSFARSAGIAINVTAGDNVAHFPIERARIRSSLYFLAASVASTAAYGWAVENARAPLGATLFITFVAGVAFTGVFNTCLTLNVDLNPTETGLASVAASVIRCLAAAVAVAILEPMLDSIGAGWTYTVYAAIGALAFPLLLILRTFGPRWRHCQWESSITQNEAAD